MKVIEKWHLHGVWNVVHGERDYRPHGYIYAWKKKEEVKWTLRRLKSTWPRCCVLL